MLKRYLFRWLLGERLVPPAVRIFLRSAILLLVLLAAKPALAAKPVTVGVFQFPPLSYTNERGEHSGLFIDIIREIAQREDWELAFVPGSWGDGFEKMRTGQLDLMPCVQQRPEREVFLDYQKEPVFVVWGQVLVRNKSNIHDIFDLSDKKIGLMKEDANGKNFLSLIANFHIPATAVFYPGFPEVAAAIAKGEVDGGVFTNTSGHGFLDSNDLRASQIVFSPADLKFATAKGTNAELLATLDRYLSEWKKDRHSPYFSLQNKYFSTAPQEKEYFWKYVAPSILSCVAIVIGVVIWRSALRRQVRKQTTRLCEELALRTKIEAELQETSQRMSAIILTAMDGFLVVGADRRILEANAAACRILGYSREEILSIGVAEIEGAMTEEEIVQLNRRMKEFGEARFESRHRRKDGSLIDVEVSIQYQPSEDGRFVSFFRDITEKKKAEEKLKANERRFSQLIQNSFDTIVILDADGIQRYVSASAERVHGYTTAELVDIPVIERMIHPDDQEKVMAAFRQIIQTGLGGVQYRHRRKCGGWVHLEARGTNQLDNPDIRGVVVNVTDITERMLVEEALRESESRFSMCMDATSDGLWDWDIATDKAYFSPAYYRMLGYEFNEFTGSGSSWGSMLHPEDRDRCMALAKSCVDGVVERFEMEFRLRQKNGGWCWVFARGKCVARGANGKATKIVGTHVDISGRKLEEDSLRESEYFFRESQRVGNIGSFTCDFVEDCWASSEILDDIFGIGCDFQKTINGWLEIVHPADRVMMGDYLRDEVFGKRKHFNKEYRILRKSDGQTRWVSGHGDVTFDEAGNALTMIGTIQDITERKNAEEERIQLQERLAQSQKMEAIGTLAGGIAHDFNNLLGAIMGYTELSLMNLPAGSEVRGNLQDVMAASERAKSLVQQILAFGRRGEKKLVDVDVTRLVAEAMKLIVSVIPKTITIEQELDPGSGCVLADPTELHQVVMNLCTNAYQVMADSGGTLRVRLSGGPVDHLEASSVPGLTQGDYVRLEVVDSGAGMDEGTMARIFEPYFTTKAQGKGTGLGLALVHGIVASLRGAIAVRSTPGVGSAFTVYIPKKVLEPMAQAEPREFGSLHGKGSVLLVDDEPALARLGAKMLETLGYTVRVMTDPIEAMRLFEGDPAGFDVIVTDQTMPGLTGANFVRRAKTVKPGMPAVMCTGYSDLIDEDGAKQIGIAAYVQKPYDRNRLGAAVAVAFSEKGKNEQQ